MNEKRRDLNIARKILVIAVLLITACTLFACGNKPAIRRFEGLSDLPANPDRIAYKTFRLSEDGTEGERIEVDVPTEKIGYVMGLLFARRYTALPKHIKIDLSNHYIRIHKGNKTWNFHASLIWHNGRWYKPIHDDALGGYLLSLI
ncbi:MAG: hypothetical protein FWD49_01275 [Firmicutes bacterium]|nr:hypothetical protein [Bacillota bacterium]